MLNTIEEFTDYCLRKLGSPVIQINLAGEQIADAVEDAILKFVEYHRDGYEEHYFIYQFLTDEAAASREIDIPRETGIDDVVEIIKYGSSISGGRFDTYAWQAGAAAMNPTAAGWSTTSLVDYSMMMQRVADINATLEDVFSFKYSKYRRKAHMLFRVNKDDVIALKTYRRVDPRVEGNSDAFNEPWLKAYATALIKERWGNVLTKVSGLKLVGGVEINGGDILSSAKEEILVLEEELKKGHQEPPSFFVG